MPLQGYRMTQQQGEVKSLGGNCYLCESKPNQGYLPQNPPIFSPNDLHSALVKNKPKNPLHQQNRVD